MNIFENIRNALGAINSNKMRSALTMLGIIIGVASVVLLVAIGQGTQQSVTAQIQNLGTNLLTVSPGSPNQTNVRFGGGTASSTLKSTDADAIKTYVTGLSGIEPEQTSRQQVVAGSQNTSTTIVGTTDAYLTVRNATVDYGSFITAQNVADMDKVAVLGSQTLATLFPSDPNPIGQDIRVGNTIFTVIGIMKAKGGQGPTNQDDRVIIPLSTMQHRITGLDSVSTISVSVANAKDMEQTQAVITAVLMNEHQITDTSKQDFTVLNQADAVQTLSNVTGTFTLLLAGIAGISLLVGGIGVMNIMLVSVTERTREIGIRKAIGAKKRDILLQFLVEAIVLSILGGLIGIAISLIGAWIATTYFSVAAIIAWSSIVLAFLFSVGVGVFFGLLPAYKAAKLRPIEALRYE
jgi:putative ABC transport system permease protein